MVFGNHYLKQDVTSWTNSLKFLNEPKNFIHFKLFLFSSQSWDGLDNVRGFEHAHVSEFNPGLVSKITDLVPYGPWLQLKPKWALIIWLYTKYRSKAGRALRIAHLF